MPKMTLRDAAAIRKKLGKKAPPRKVDRSLEDAFHRRWICFMPLCGRFRPIWYQSVGGQCKPIKGRKWECDFVWTRQEPEILVGPPSLMLGKSPPGVILEVAGGTWMPKGGHNTGKAIRDDFEKHNALTAAGWKVFYTDGGFVRDDKRFNVLAEQIFKAITEGT